MIAQDGTDLNFNDLARACELIADETLIMTDRGRATLRLAARAVRELGPRLERIELALRVSSAPDPWNRGWT